MQKVLTLFNQSKEPQIICLGEALLDRLGPLGGDPIVDLPVTDCLGGAPVNVACCLARLGTSVAFCGRLGSDFIKDRFLAIFKERDINYNAIQVDNYRSTRIVYVKRDLAGERVFQGFSTPKGGQFSDQALNLKQLTDNWSMISSQAKWLVLGTIPLSSPESKQSFLWCLEEALKSRINIAIDVNWRPTFWDPANTPAQGPDEGVIKQILAVLEKISLLKLAKEEALWFFNTDDPRKISLSLTSKPNVVVTNGPMTLSWLINGFYGQINPIPPREINDSTGAGDAFMAGLLHKLVQNNIKNLDEKKIVQIIRFASACGSLVCEREGAIEPQPTIKEVDDFITYSEGR